MYKKYKSGINITDGVDTALFSTSVIMAGVRLAVPVRLPLEIVAIVCGCMGVCVKLLRRKLMSNTQKHYEIKTRKQVKFYLEFNFHSLKIVRKLRHPFRGFLGKARRMSTRTRYG